MVPHGMVFNPPALLHGAVDKLGKSPGFHPGHCAGSMPVRSAHGALVQTGERRFLRPEVRGSSPLRTTRCDVAQMEERVAVNHRQRRFEPCRRSHAQVPEW
jgi:hypothetical protein